MRFGKSSSGGGSDGDDWDGLQDWAFVVIGAFAAAQPWLLVPMAGYLRRGLSEAGYLRRADG